MYKPCEAETCSIVPCGEDCDYMSASLMRGVSQFLRERAELRRQGLPVPALPEIED